MRKNTKRALSLILSLVLALAMLPSMASAADYDSHWAKAQAEALIEKGIVTPDSSGNVNPNRNLSRAEMATLINKAFSLTEKGDISGFSDVVPGSWYEEQIAIAVGAGYLSGYPDGTVRPGGNITRQEVAAVASKVLKLEPNAGAASAFSDSFAIGSWALGAVGAAVEGGLMNGYPDGTFQPQNNMTRAESFVVLLGMMGETPAVEEEPAGDDVTVKEGETFGSETEVTVVQNLIIDGKDSKVLNVTVKGDLTITAAVGDGDVTLVGVVVEGQTFIRGGGPNSVNVSSSSIQESQMSEVFIQKTDVTFRLDSGSVSNVHFEMGAKLANNGGTISRTVINTGGTVTITGRLPDMEILQRAAIVLSNGIIEKLRIDSGAADTKIMTNADSSIGEVIANGLTTFQGQGPIGSLEANVPGIVCERNPGEVSGESAGSVAIVPAGGGGGGGTNISTGNDDPGPNNNLASIVSITQTGANTIDVVVSLDTHGAVGDPDNDLFTLTSVEGSGITGVTGFNQTYTQATKTYGIKADGNFKGGEAYTLTIKTPKNGTMRRTFTTGVLAGMGAETYTFAGDASEEYVVYDNVAKTLTVDSTPSPIDINLTGTAFAALFDEIVGTGNTFTIDAAGKITEIDVSAYGLVSDGEEEIVLNSTITDGTLSFTGHGSEVAIIVAPSVDVTVAGGGSATVISAARDVIVDNSAGTVSLAPGAYWDATGGEIAYENTPRAITGDVTIDDINSDATIDSNMIMGAGKKFTVDEDTYDVMINGIGNTDGITLTLASIPAALTLTSGNVIGHASEPATLIVPAGGSISGTLESNFFYKGEDEITNPPAPADTYNWVEGTGWVAKTIEKPASFSALTESKVYEFVATMDAEYTASVPRGYLYYDAASATLHYNESGASSSWDQTPIEIPASDAALRTFMNQIKGAGNRLMFDGDGDIIQVTLNSDTSLAVSLAASQFDGTAVSVASIGSGTLTITSAGSVAKIIAVTGRITINNAAAVDIDDGAETLPKNVTIGTASGAVEVAGTNDGATTVGITRAGSLTVTGKGTVTAGDIGGNVTVDTADSTTDVTVGKALGNTITISGGRNVNITSVGATTITGGANVTADTTGAVTVDDPFSGVATINNADTVTVEDSAAGKVIIKAAKGAITIDTDGEAEVELSPTNTNSFGGTITITEAKDNTVKLTSSVTLPDGETLEVDDNQTLALSTNVILTLNEADNTISDTGGVVTGAAGAKIILGTRGTFDEIGDTKFYYTGGVREFLDPTNEIRAGEYVWTAENAINNVYGLPVTAGWVAVGKYSPIVFTDLQGAYTFVANADDVEEGAGRIFYDSTNRVIHYRSVGSSLKNTIGQLDSVDNKDMIEFFTDMQGVNNTVTFGTSDNAGKLKAINYKGSTDKTVRIAIDIDDTATSGVQVTGNTNNTVSIDAAGVNVEVISGNVTVTRGAAVTVTNGKAVTITKATGSVVIDGGTAVTVVDAAGQTVAIGGGTAVEVQKSGVVTITGGGTITLGANVASVAQLDTGIGNAMTIKSAGVDLEIPGTTVSGLTIIGTAPADKVAVTGSNSNLVLTLGGAVDANAATIAATVTIIGDATGNADVVLPNGKTVTLGASATGTVKIKAAAEGAGTVTVTGGNAGSTDLTVIGATIDVGGADCASITVGGTNELTLTADADRRTVAVVDNLVPASTGSAAVPVTILNLTGPATSDGGETCIITGGASIATLNVKVGNADLSGVTGAGDAGNGLTIKLEGEGTSTHEVSVRNCAEVALLTNASGSTITTTSGVNLKISLAAFETANTSKSNFLIVNTLGNETVTLDMGKAVTQQTGGDEKDNAVYTTNATTGLQYTATSNLTSVKLDASGGTTNQCTLPTTTGTYTISVEKLGPA